MTEWVIGGILMVLFLLAVVQFKGKDPRFCPHEECHNEGSITGEQILEGSMFFTRIVTYSCPVHGTYQVMEHLDEQGVLHLSPYSA